jgi:hypothetical protein
MYDDATRAKARTIAEARGLSAAATVTGIGISTLKRWATAEGWHTAHSRKNPPPAVTPVLRPVAANEKEEQARSAHSRDPARELQEDAALAREVFRAQGRAVLDGHGKPVWFKDAAIAHGILQDKRHAYGSPVSRNPGQPGLTPEEQRAAREAHILRLIDVCEQVDARNGHGDG